jgi:hypothetical protein
MIRAVQPPEIGREGIIRREMRSAALRAHRRGLTAVLAAVAVLSARAAVAGATEADDLIKRGLEARRGGRDDEALGLFKRAHEIDHGARSVAQMGFAEQALGLWIDAEVHLHAALARPDDPWIAKNQTAIRRALEVIGSHLGSLEVRGTPAGAEIWIGDARAGVLPLSAPLRVTAGTVPLTVRADGFLELSRVIDVVSGTLVRERFDLPRKAAQPVALEAVPPRPQPQAKVIVERPRDAAEAPETAHPVWRRWWFWTLLGAVAVGGAATAYLLARPRSDCPAGEMCATIPPP